MEAKINGVCVVADDIILRSVLVFCAVLLAKARTITVIIAEPSSLNRFPCRGVE